MPWHGERLLKQFASRRGRAWTLGYESVQASELASQATWEGSFPSELCGLFYRNGPARHEVSGRRYGHRWDGDGMVQRFQLSSDGVIHVGRFVQTRKLLDEEAAGQMLYSAFGTSVDHLQPTPEHIEASNPANISIVRFRGELLALWEAGQPYVLDSKSLATVGRVNWLDVDRPAPFSAHPKFDADGSLWNFGIDPISDKLLIYNICRDGIGKRFHEMYVKDISPVHDFGITDRYLIFLLPSITCNRTRLMTGASFAESCQWSPQLGMRVLVIQKSDFQCRELRLPPGCLFHVSNAWEEADSIYVDYLRSSDPSSFLAGWSVMAGEYRYRRGAFLTRASLDLRGGEAHQETLLEHDIEFPSILENDVARAYRQLLCVERSAERASDVPGYDSLSVIDVSARTRQTYFFGDDWLVEEHLLIEDVAGKSPRWALGTALNLKSQKTVVSVFDVERLSCGPIATAQLPYSLPLGLHGTYVGELNGEG